jgi:hypothetical protein
MQVRSPPCLVPVSDPHVEIALLSLAQKHRHGVNRDINWNLAFKSCQHEVTLDASR